jgi:hypothetical protein
VTDPLTNAVFRTTSEAAEVEYDYIIVTMKALPDVYDDGEIIRPGTAAQHLTRGLPHSLLIQLAYCSRDYR